MKTTVSQRRAIESDAKEIVCIAGPGSGKTATTVARIKRLIDDGVDPKTIVALTFTNAGADELRERLQKAWPTADENGQLLNGFDGRLGFTGTLHAFALRMLKTYGAAIGYGERLAIVGEEAAADLLASKAATLGCKTRLQDLMKIKTSYAFTPSKNNRLSKDELVIVGYQQDLRDAGLVDFDTILTEFRNLIVTPPPEFIDLFDHLFVDEAQDSAEIDWQIYEALPIANKFYVGDPDQAIYSFRGGRVDLLLRKAANLGPEKDAMIVLQDNFRSHSEITAACDNLIARNKARVHKHSVSVKGPGGVVAMAGIAANEGEEIAQVCRAIKNTLSDSDKLGMTTAILARTNALCHAYRQTLKACGIPVAEPPKSDFPRDWALARALVELLVQPENDTLAFFYLMADALQKGIPPTVARKETQKAFLEARSSGKTLNQHRLRIYALASSDGIGVTLAEHGVSAESRMRVAGLLKQIGPGADPLTLALAMSNNNLQETSPSPGVCVSTIHGAKGREFDVVFVVGCEEEVWLHKNDDPEEARRLMFVACSRARKALYLAYSESRVTPWGKIEGHVPSRFLRELLDA